MHPTLQPLFEKIKSGEPVKIIMFGDSITFGSQIDPDFDHEIVYHKQWHDVISRRFPEAKIEIQNRGVPGHKINHAHDRLEKEVLAENPDLVVIEFGINDCWDGEEMIENFEREMARLVDRIRAASDMPIVLLTANMLNHKVNPGAEKLAWFVEKTAAVQTNGWTQRYMERVAKVASKHDIPLANGYAEWEKVRAAGTDTDMLLANLANHPNRDGHRLLARSLLTIFDIYIEE